ncbi:MAG TPA: HEAT repeat domain-containing protein, partial [Gemmatimonadaceae bacterium]
FIGVALAITALSSAAQNPTTPPAPAAPSPEAKPAQPSRAPKAKVLRVPPQVWGSDDMLDLSDRLHVIEDMNMDYTLAPPPTPFIDLDIEPADLAWDVTPSPMDFDFDFDFANPPVAPFADMAPMWIQSIEPIEPMEPMEPVEPMEPMDLIGPAPLAPVIPMTPMVPLSPMVPATAMPPLSVWDVGPGSPQAIIAKADALAAIERVQGSSPFERQFAGISSEPPQSWNQSDPADSLYKLARQALNRGEYRRAAQLFGDIGQKFPNSVYAADSRYWRAFALYRIGGSSDLRDALASLQDTGRAYRTVSLTSDAPVLATRIRAALAAQGDPNARKAVSDAATQSGTACDREDLAVRVEALNSLGQTDPESTTPILRRVLGRRDDCSATLRRAAIYILGRRTDDEARDLVIGAARNDPDIRVRAEALRFLAAMPGDQAIATIEEMARTPGNEELQRAAISALGRSDNPRARQSLRNIIERADVGENLRVTALTSIDRDRSTDNGAYIRSIYPRLDTPRLKAAAIQAVARAGGADNDQWLLSLVRNQNEPSDVRAMALRYAGRSTVVPVADLAKMYDAAADRPLREQLIRLYAERTEPEATDKLLDIARAGTDPDMRRYAISALSRKNDPRTKKLLLEIIDK